jgi:hypothetical protein
MARKTGSQELTGAAVKLQEEYSRVGVQINGVWHGWDRPNAYRDAIHGYWLNVVFPGEGAQNRFLGRTKKDAQSAIKDFAVELAILNDCIRTGDC